MSEHSRPSTLLRVLALGAVLALVVWWMRRSESPPPSTLDERAPSVEIPPAPAEAPAPADDAAPAVEDSAAMSAEDGLAAEAGADTSSWRLRGLVLLAHDQSGVAGVRVTLTPMRAGGDPAVSSVSNALGEVDFELVGEQWRAGQVRLATAIDELTGAQRFQGPVRLDPGFTLLLDELVTLRGRVATSLRPRDPQLELTFTRPTTPAAPVRRFVASARTDTTGWFEQAARVPPGVDVLRLSVAVDGRTAALFDTPLALLTSPSGVDLFVELSELHVLVRDSRGAPLAGAELRAAAFDSDPDDFPPVAATDEHGRAQLALPAADYELCVGKSGYCSRIEYVQLSPQGAEVELELGALESEHEFFGVVIDDSGAPVAGAFVSLAPTTFIEELAVAGIDGQRTDAQGEFRLRACSSAALELTAFHRDFGLSQPLEVRADGIRLVVTLRRTGRLEVELLTDALPGVFRDGAIEYVLAPTDGREVTSGVAYASPFVLDELLAGDYDVFVTLPGMRACAVGFARVEANRTSSTLLAAQGASWLEGRVLDESGAALSFLDVVALGAWPEPAAQVLLWGRTDLEGRFRVLSPRPTARLSVRDDQGELTAHDASASDALELRLP